MRVGLSEEGEQTILHIGDRRRSLLCLGKLLSVSLTAVRSFLLAFLCHAGEAVMDVDGLAYGGDLPAGLLLVAVPACRKIFKLDDTFDDLATRGKCRIT